MTSKVLGVRLFVGSVLSALMMLSMVPALGAPLMSRSPSLTGVVTDTSGKPIKKVSICAPDVVDALPAVKAKAAHSFELLTAQRQAAEQTLLRVMNDPDATPAMKMAAASAVEDARKAEASVKERVAALNDATPCVTSSTDGSFRMYIPTNVVPYDTFMLVANVPGHYPAQALVTSLTRVVSLTMVTIRVKAMTPRKPSIKGRAAVGHVVKVKMGSWKPGKVIFTYQWFRDGKNVAGAVRSSYLLVAADKSKKVTVKVTGTKSGYRTVSRTSKGVRVHR